MKTTFKKAKGQSRYDIFHNGAPVGLTLEHVKEDSKWVLCSGFPNESTFGDGCYLGSMGRKLACAKVAVEKILKITKK